MKFSKISLVLLSCLSLGSGAAIKRNENVNNIDLSEFFSNLIPKQEKTDFQIGSKASINEIDDDYTQELEKYSKLFIDFVKSEKAAAAAKTTTTTTTTTTVEATATSDASKVINDIHDLSAVFDDIKSKKDRELGELFDVIETFSEKLDVLEKTVEEVVAKQEAEQEVAKNDEGIIEDNGNANLKYAKIDNDIELSPVNADDFKYTAIFKALNKENEEKFEAMQENQMKILGEIKNLISVNMNEKEEKEEKEVADKEPSDNGNQFSVSPETSEEAIKEQLEAENEEFNELYNEIKKTIDDYKDMVSQKKENVTSDEQFNMAVMVREKTKIIKQYINKLASLAETKSQKDKISAIYDYFDEVENAHIKKVNKDEKIIEDEKQAKEAAAEQTTEQKPESANIYKVDDVEEIIDKIASNTTNEKEVNEVQRILKEIQLINKNKEAKVNETEVIDNALLQVSANTTNEEEVEEVRKIITAVEAKDIKESNMKKESVIEKLIYDISSKTTNQEQVAEVKRILEKIGLFNKFALGQEEAREDNLKFGHEMADEITKGPEQINKDLKSLINGLINNITTEEDAENVGNIIHQIKLHEDLIKEKNEKEAVQYIDENGEAMTSVPNVKVVKIEDDEGHVNDIFFMDESKLVEPAEPQPIESQSTSGNGSMFILGAFGVIALAGAGYTYRSRARKLNDEFPFSDSNLPFSDSMNGLVVNKGFLFNKFNKSTISKPENIVNNDSVIRPSQPSWATSKIMDDYKESESFVEDPEELLDEQLREIENKEKVIIKSNYPSIVINIGEEKIEERENENTQEASKKNTMKPKSLRRSAAIDNLDKKIKEEKKKQLRRVESKRFRPSKSLSYDDKAVLEESDLDEETELTLNTSFMLEDPSLLFKDESVKETKEKTKRRNKKRHSNKPPKVPKRSSSCTLEALEESNDILPKLELDKECLENPFSQDVMEDYKKKLDEMN